MEVAKRVAIVFSFFPESLENHKNYEVNER
jgi:hypothetical protein